MTHSFEKEEARALRTLRTRDLVWQIANMTTEEEIQGGMTWEDAVSTLNSLIEQARQITGVDPGHPRLYCAGCGQDAEDCYCDRATEVSED